MSEGRQPLRMSLVCIMVFVICGMVTTAKAAPFQMQGMYMLYYGGEWSTGYTRVVSFDRPRGRSPSGLAKLTTTSVNGVDHKQTAIVFL